MLATVCSGAGCPCGQEKAPLGVSKQLRCQGFSSLGPELRKLKVSSKEDPHGPCVKEIKGSSQLDHSYSWFTFCLSPKTSKSLACLWEIKITVKGRGS